MSCPIFRLAHPSDGDRFVMTAIDLYDFLIHVQRIPSDDVTLADCIELISEFAYGQESLSARPDDVSPLKQRKNSVMHNGGGSPATSPKMVRQTSYSQQVRRTSVQQAETVFLNEIGFTSFLISYHVSVQQIKQPCVMHRYAPAF